MGNFVVGQLLFTLWASVSPIDVPSNLYNTPIHPTFLYLKDIGGFINVQSESDKEKVLPLINIL